MRNIDHVELKALYLDQRETVPNIAKHLGCSATTIYKHLKKLGLSREQRFRVEEEARELLQALNTWVDEGGAVPVDPGK